MFNRLMRTIRAAAFMSPRDIGLFLQSSKTDTAIGRARVASGDAAAFDAAYATGDPWASIDSRYRYQRRKYQSIYNVIPAGKRFGRVLDIGAGLGSMGRLFASRADEVIGIDISQEAVMRARELHAGVGNLRFERGDICKLPASFNGAFDLVVLADTLYYLPPPITDSVLKEIALQISALLAPGGMCLLANHFFFAADPDSRLSRRIHDAFTWSPGFNLISGHRRPFFLVSLLAGADPPTTTMLRR